MNALLIALLFSFPAAQDGALNQDFTRLSQPSTAAKLGLTDNQRSTIVSLLTDRINELAAAKPNARAAIRKANSEALAAVLTDPQKQQFAALVIGGKLRFNFRGEKWGNVLNWFAKESGSSLVMDISPPGEFTYSDVKEYTPAQAIDLLNSVLQSKGFTLIRREKMLIVSEVSDGIPYDLVPEITPDQLPERGKFEWVRIYFPIGARPIDQVMKEIKPMLSEHGQATPLVASKKLMVTDTAGKMNALSLLIAAVPEPASAPAAASSPAAPPKIFSVLPAKGIDIDAAVTTLKGLFPSAKFFGDATAEQVQIYAIQSELDVIKTSIEQMVANASTDLHAFPEVYYVGKNTVEQVAEQVKVLYPDAQIAFDVAKGRVIVVADSRVQAAINSFVDKLGLPDVEKDGAMVVVYPVAQEQSDAVAAVLTELVPKSKVIAQPGRIAVFGNSADQAMAKTLIEQLETSEDATSQNRLKFYSAKNFDSSAVASLVAIAPEA
ncbi:MAG: hypothetical protein ACI814_000171, partial [Mariniblastus sp.]